MVLPDTTTPPLNALSLRKLDRPLTSIDLDFEENNTDLFALTKRGTQLILKLNNQIKITPPHRHRL